MTKADSSATSPDAATLETYVDARRHATAEQWDLDDEIVLVGAGEPIHQPGRADRVYPFLPHSEYFYLTERVRPGSVLAYATDGGWTDFVPPVSQDEKVWEGAEDAAAAGGTPLPELQAWLAARQDRPVAVLGSPVDGVEADPGLTDRLRQNLLTVRRPKDPLELERLRRAVSATAAGFAAVREHIRPGVRERDLQVELEAAFFRAGGERTGYDTIVGAGTNAAVLHFAPGERRLEADELLLIDAGAEIDFYTADVTRTYPAGDRFTPEQRDLYAVVLEAEKNAIERCRPGVEYRQIHLDAALDITRGLVDFGVLVGNPESLVERDAHALFFPHGVGHMVGLGVRDASGYLPGRQRSDRPGLRFLRMDLPLAAGYTLTIEPGLYFIPALLDDPDNREHWKDAVNWERADALKDFGGIRIEDDILVTDDGPENLTAEIPKEIDDLEG